MATLLPLLSMGCSSFDRLDFESISSPPVTVKVDYDRIELQEGISVAVKAIPIDTSDDTMDEDTGVSLTTNAPSVLGVAQGPKDVSQGDPEEPVPVNWNFILFGAGPGETTVTVVIDGEEMKDIPVAVLRQQ